MRALRPLTVALALAGCVPAARRAAPAPGATPLAAALDSIFADTAFAHAHWGVLVRSARTGEVLYRRDAERLFVPASNMKLVTGAAALELLGPDHRYRTSFSATGRVRNGVLEGDLIVRGSGDPTWSGRFGDDPRATLRAWADSLRAHGVTRIAGGIIGVDSAFTGPALGAGWAWDDLGAGYAAEFGALQFNEGVVELQLVPSRSAGAPPIPVLDPPTQYLTIHNRAVTGAPGTPVTLAIERDPAGPGITLTGSVPADTPFVVEQVALRDPTAYFLAVLRETLREAGVAVEGQALAAGDWPEALPGEPSRTPLFAHLSPPLREILPAMMKPSQNWIAETLLLTVGREVRGEGSARAGVAAVDSLLRAWGLPAHQLRVADGSGLSRYNLVSPALFVELLARMDRSPHREVWRASLPVGGDDGTLANRMREAPLRGNVRAKTGTLSGVRGLSGYLDAPGAEPVVFSVLVNHHLRSAAAADRVVEAALRRVAATPAR